MMLPYFPLLLTKNFPVNLFSPFLISTKYIPELRSLTSRLSSECDAVTLEYSRIIRPLKSLQGLDKSLNFVMQPANDLFQELVKCQVQINRIAYHSQELLRLVNLCMQPRLPHRQDSDRFPVYFEDGCQKIPAKPDSLVL